MKYKNVSEKAITVQQATQAGARSLTIQPGAEFVTSPIHAAALLEAGQIEQVRAKAEKSVARTAKQEKTEIPE